MLEIKPICEKLCLGKQGENLARRVYFKEPELWKEKFGEGVCTLLHKRNGDEAPYPVNLDVEDGKYCWKITDIDTSFAGMGECELYYSVNGVVVKSKIWPTHVQESLGADVVETPEAAKPWVDEVLEAAEDVKSATTHQPVIGDNGNWYVWELESGEYIDTGVKASGGEGNGYSKEEINNMVLKSVDLSKVVTLTDGEADITADTIKPINQSVGYISGTINVVGYCEIEVENTSIDTVTLTINSERYEAAYLDNTSISFKGIVTEPISFDIEVAAIAKFTKFITTGDYWATKKATELEIKAEELEVKVTELNEEKVAAEYVDKKLENYHTSEEIRAITMKDIDLRKVATITDGEGTISEKEIHITSWGSANNGYAIVGQIDVSGYIELDARDGGIDDVTLTINGKRYMSISSEADPVIKFKGVVTEPIIFEITGYSWLKVISFVSSRVDELEKQVGDIDTALDEVEKKLEEFPSGGGNGTYTTIADITLTEEVNSVICADVNSFADISKVGDFYIRIWMPEHDVKSAGTLRIMLNDAYVFGLISSFDYANNYNLNWHGYSISTPSYYRFNLISNAFSANPFSPSDNVRTTSSIINIPLNKIAINITDNGVLPIGTIIKIEGWVK